MKAKLATEGVRGKGRGGAKGEQAVKRGSVQGRRVLTWLTLEQRQLGQKREQKALHGDQNALGSHT